MMLKKPEVTEKTSDNCREAIDQALRKISFCKVRVSFVALEPIYLSSIKGSALRGCLIEAYKHHECRNRGIDCLSCHLKYNCKVSQLFEYPLIPGQSLFGKYTRPPKPYILVPMEGRDTRIETGSIFYFDLILIGSFIEKFADLIKTFQKMGEIGIGSRRSKFKPVRLEHYFPESGFQPLPVFDTPHYITTDQLPVVHLSTRASIDFKEHFRFLKNGRPVEKPPEFNMMVKYLARRLCLLAHLYCGADWVDTDANPLTIGQVAIRSDQLKPEHWVRFSRSHEGKTPADGLAGVITYEGDLQPWSDLLNLGSWLHAGSMTTFGLGKYSLLPDE